MHLILVMLSSTKSSADKRVDRIIYMGGGARIYDLHTRPVQIEESGLAGYRLNALYSNSWSDLPKRA